MSLKQNISIGPFDIIIQSVGGTFVLWTEAPGMEAMQVFLTMIRKGQEGYLEHRKAVKAGQSFGLGLFSADPISSQDEIEHAKRYWQSVADSAFPEEEVTYRLWADFADSAIYIPQNLLLELITLEEKHEREAQSLPAPWLFSNKPTANRPCETPKNGPTEKALLFGLQEQFLRTLEESDGTYYHRNTGKPLDEADEIHEKLAQFGLMTDELASYKKSWLEKYNCLALLSFYSRKVDTPTSEAKKSDTISTLFGNIGPDLLNHWNSELDFIITEVIERGPGQDTGEMTAKRKVLQHEWLHHHFFTIRNAEAKSDQLEAWQLDSLADYFRYGVELLEYLNSNERRKLVPDATDLSEHQLFQAPIAVEWFFNTHPPMGTNMDEFTAQCERLFLANNRPSQLWTNALGYKIQLLGCKEDGVNQKLVAAFFE